MLEKAQKAKTAHEFEIISKDRRFYGLKNLSTITSRWDKLSLVEVDKAKTEDEYYSALDDARTNSAPYKKAARNLFVLKCKKLSGNDLDMLRRGGSDRGIELILKSLTHLDNLDELTFLLSMATNKYEFCLS